MLSENRFSKYLLYAIGEIILVVIGILIAVQINTVVNDNQRAKENGEYLRKMISELELNKKRMNFLRQGDSTKRPSQFPFMDRAIQNCDSMIQLTYRGLTEEDLPFFTSTGLNDGGSTLNLHNSVYEELIHTGKLYNLGSDELVTAIKDYYKRCEREDLYNKRITAEILASGEKIEGSFKKLRLDFKYDSAGFNLENYPWYFDPQSEEYQAIQIAAVNMKQAQSLNSWKMKGLQAYSDSLIRVIEEELHRHDN